MFGFHAVQRMASGRLHLEAETRPQGYDLEAKRQLISQSRAKKRHIVLGAVWLVGVLTAVAHANLTDAYTAMGFNPSAPGNAVVVLFSDPHINLDPVSGVITTNLDLRLVNNVNAMSPPPARIIVAGDLTSGYSPGSGFLPNWNNVRTLGSNEMRFWSTAVQAFTNVPQTNILYVPGNHDQDPRETDAELFCQMFPNMPPYQDFDLAGVRFFLLNGGNLGFPSESQKEWLKQRVLLTSPTQTVAVVIHQPPFDVNRGNSIMLQEYFQNWSARWWAFCGHSHYFSQSVYDVGRSNVTMTTLGTVNTNVSNGQSLSTGFMVLCLSNGIAGRVYYRFLNGSFEVVAEPEWGSPSHFVPSFGEVPGLLWRREKNPPRGSVPPEVILTNFFYDAYYSFAYVGELQWALPLAQHGNQATHFLVSTYISPGDASVAFSADRTNWIGVPVCCRTNGIYSFPIPAQVAGLATGYARLLSSTVNTNAGNNYANLSVEGWGLATTNPRPWVTFPKLAPVPNKSIVAGRILTFANVAIDPYAPPDVLNFSLLSAPIGATVDPHSGLFSWQPPIANSPTTATVTVKVADNGGVPMCATQQFSVSVGRPAVPTITLPQWVAGRCGFTVSGDHGVGYTVWASTNLVDWTPIIALNPPVVPFQITDPNTAKFPYRFYRVTVAPWLVWDADATNFLARAGIPLTTNNTIPTAINSLVLNAKAHGWWTNCDTIYPFVGATATSHALNLKSTNYNILWHGAMTHDASGVTGDGLTGYGDTRFNPHLVHGQFRENLAHVFVYCGTQALPDYGVLLGCSAADYSSCSILWSVGGFVGGGLNEEVYAGIGIYTGDLRGPMLVSRTSSTAEFLAIGDSLRSGTTTADSVPNANLGILAVIHDDGGVAHYCPANLRGVTIGGGLTPEQWEHLQQDWDEFQTMLGRKTP